MTREDIAYGRAVQQGLPAGRHAHGRSTVDYFEHLRCAKSFELARRDSGADDPCSPGASAGKMLVCERRHLTLLHACSNDRYAVSDYPARSFASRRAHIFNTRIARKLRERGQILRGSTV